MSLSVLTRGGGSSGFFPSIFITGLSGSDTVTAKNGSISKVGVWNSAKSRFEITKIKDLGTWIVTATNGSKTVSQSVSIDAIIDYEIEMVYRDYLYAAGNEYTSVTGGWNTNPFSHHDSTATKAASYIQLYASAPASGDTAKYAGVVTKNAIDFSKSNTLYVNLSSAGASETGYKYFQIKILSAYDDTNSVKTANVGGAGLHTLDVSDLSGKYYIELQIYAYYNRNMSANIDAVYLE